MSISRSRPRSSREEAFTNELKSALENAIPAVHVVQPQKLPAAGDDAQALTADLQRVRLYVQVVGYGQPPRQGIQKKFAEDRKLPLLFWKAEDVDLAEVEDEGLKSLIQQARLGTVEDAKRAIIERLAELAKPATSTNVQARTGETWFINYLPEDKDLGQRTFTRLAERFECIKRPLSGASEAELRAYFEDKLLECDHMVMVYGRASRLSVNEQVRSCFKVVASKRPVRDAIAEWFVVVGPPQPPDAEVELDVGCRGFRLRAVDCRDDFEGCGSTGPFSSSCREGSDESETAHRESSAARRHRESVSWLASVQAVGIADLLRPRSASRSVACVAAPRPFPGRCRFVRLRQVVAGQGGPVSGVTCGAVAVRARAVGGRGPFSGLVVLALVHRRYAAWGTSLSRAARGLLDSELLASTWDIHDPGSVPALSARLEAGPRHLLRLWQQAEGSPSGNLLILADQFEELFRFRDGDNFGLAQSFVSSLLELSRQEEWPIYVVITMRSDFLGECSQFLELPETLNKGQFLVPRLTSAELCESIIGPARLFGVELDPLLVTRMLNDIGNDSDQLPLLQHALKRTWDLSGQGYTSGEAGLFEGPFGKLVDNVAQGERGLLTLADYDRREIGGVTQALRRHADELFEKLHGADENDGDKRLARILFQSLTLRDNGRDVRRPAKLGAVAQIAGVDETDVARIVEVFREPACCFLMPPVGTPLTSEVMLDISHESLLRQWNRLQKWIAQGVRVRDELPAIGRRSPVAGRALEGLRLDRAIALAGQPASDPRLGDAI